jgi:beta-glucosidase
VVQLYVSAVKPSTPAPIAALKAFQRVSLAPGASQTLTFPITAGMLAIVNDAGKDVVEKGGFRIRVGGVAPGARGNALGASPLADVLLTVR